MNFLKRFLSQGFLFELMGAYVEWNQATQAAKATLDNTAITFCNDDIKASVNKTPQQWMYQQDVLTIRVALRFFSEKMGIVVTRKDAARMAIIE